MRCLHSISCRVSVSHERRRLNYTAWLQRRNLLTLAIETSCDDTSVAVLERQSIKAPGNGLSATLHFHEKVTAKTDAYQGIHPIIALESHQSSLGPLVQKAIQHLPKFSPQDSMPSISNLLPGSHDGELRRKPDFISVTRGPGMRSNLSVGLDTAKGLSTAWNIPLLGVHHMQAHALTPGLISALNLTSSLRGPSSTPSLRTPGSIPPFPFLSILVSGGHTLLLSSSSITSHTILASTGDIAIGDLLDKAARQILPSHLLSSPFGKALEDFAFPSGAADYERTYAAPKNRGEELDRRRSEWGWSFGPPLAESKGGRASNRMAYSFSGLLTAVQRIFRERGVGTVVDLEADGRLESNRGDGPDAWNDGKEISEEERRDMACEVMRVAFEHLGGRLLLHLKDQREQGREDVKTVVVAGGVAANRFLRYVLRSMLDVRGFQDVKLSFPPVEFCTDNAAMIGWAGCEMWDEEWRSELSIRPIRKWSLDGTAEDGGILGVGGWTKR